MTITVGTTRDDKRVLTKTWSGTEISVTLKAPCDVLNPTFILKYNASFLTCNYIYCPDFTRYYFITNIVVETGNRMEISCSVDVLMSYQAQIKNLSCHLVRSQTIRAPYISDSQKPLTTKTQTQTYVFDKTPFVSTDGFACYVLTVVGGMTSGS